jgi:hypothetical protein
MRTFLASLCLVLFLPIRPGSAQQCPAGPADTIPNAGDAGNGMALYWPVPQVRDALREVLRSLKYQLNAPVSDTAGLETRPSFRLPEFPNASIADRFAHYKHPGIVVRAFVRSEADSSRLFVFARSICHVVEAPPAGYAVPVENTIELLAAQEIAFGVVDVLRRKHPRRFRF